MFYERSKLLMSSQSYNFLSLSEKGRHFHVGDFEEMGRDFCEVLLEYSEAKNGNR